MTQIPTSDKTSPSRWRVLWRPLLLVALGFHAGLLFFPWQSLQIKPSKPEAGESVKLGRLTTLKPERSEAEKIEAQAEAIRRASQAELKVKASPTPSPSPSPKAIKPSPTPSPKAAQPAKPTPSPKAKAPPAAKPNEPTATLTQAEKGFVSRLQKLEGREVTEQVSSTLFPSPEVFYKDPAKEIGKPGIVGIEYVSLQRPEEVYQQLRTLYPDYVIAPKPDYGDGLVYEFKKGSFVRYLNLVRAKLGAGTLVVLWNRQPS
jgi:hypothetical protein